MHRTILIGTLGLLSGCSNNDELARRMIQEYSAASCLDLAPPRAGETPTRRWDTRVRLADGTEVAIQGFRQRIGGLSVSWSDGKMLVAKLPDYVYPSDVRVDIRAASMFVRGDGLAVSIFGSRTKTLLHQYNLYTRQLVEGLEVNPSSLPIECKEKGRTI